MKNTGNGDKQKISVPQHMQLDMVSPATALKMDTQSYAASQPLTRVTDSKELAYAGYSP